MSATAAPPPAAPAPSGPPPNALTRLRALAARRPALLTAAGLLTLVVLSAWLRSQALDAKFWIDEGLSVGIASHSFWDIPSVLRLDGSPPLYYMLLHVWTQVVGDGEARTHALSLLIALACIPTAYWAGATLFGRRQAWGAAIVAATLPYLTYYAQETRMYALVVLLSLVTVTTFAATFGLRRRGWRLGFAAAAAGLAYTHNWGLFLLAACGAAWLLITWRAHGQERRDLRTDGLIGFGVLTLLYAPWLPTLLQQAQETGAPWAERPGLSAIVNAFSSLWGGPESAMLAIFMGVAGVGAALQARRATPQGRALALALGAVVGGIALAWLASQASPAWANRYWAVFAGPMLLLLGVALTNWGRLGIAALLILALFGTDGRERQLKSKSDAFRVAQTLLDRAYVTPGDVVLNTHPEHGPVMRYYLGGDLRWADALGWVDDPWVFDWRDALDRLERTGPIEVMRDVLPEMERGQRLLLIQPIVRTGRWGAPWTRLVRKRAQQWERALDHLPQLRREAAVPDFSNKRLPRGVRAVVYVRTGAAATAQDVVPRGGDGAPIDPVFRR